MHPSVTPGSVGQLVGPADCNSAAFAPWGFESLHSHLARALVLPGVRFDAVRCGHLSGADDILLDLPVRVAKTLLRLAGRNGRPPLVIEAHQRLVAALAGGSRQTVNQVLKHFARRGWVQVEKSRIVVVDQDALRRRSGQPPGLSQSDGVSAPDKIPHPRLVAGGHAVSGR